MPVMSVVGITPPKFDGADVSYPADIWISHDQAVPLTDESRRVMWLRIMARLRPGATRGQAEAEVQALLDKTVQLESGATGYSRLRSSLSRPLLLLEMLAGLLLLITCANLANLVLAGAASRERELAVRRALGATSGSVALGVIRDGAVMAALGIAAGAAISFAGGKVLASRVVGVEGSAPGLLVGVAALLLAVAVAASWLPAWRASHVDPVEALRTE